MKTSYYFLLTLLILVIIILLIPFVVYHNGRKHIYTSISDIEPSSVAIVFGAGLTLNNTPSDALNDRLTVAAELYESDKIKSILVSGDNRTQDYNEPEVMKHTLIETFSIPEDDIHTDYAGRRTYDTCRRAHDLWGIEEALLISQGYHLPRAIWTCGTLGITSSGINSTLQPYIKEIPFKIREVLAIYKAFIDLYIIEPDFIGGDFIQDLNE